MHGLTAEHSQGSGRAGCFARTRDAGELAPTERQECFQVVVNAFFVAPVSGPVTTFTTFVLLTQL
jgi:hypothetical protein